VLGAIERAIGGVDLTGSPMVVSEELNQAIAGIIGGDHAVRDYLGRSLLEASDASQQLFDALVDLIDAGLMTLEAGGFVHGQLDRTWRSFAVLFIILGPIVLSRQIEARLQVDAFDPDVVHARSVCNIEILRHGLFRAV